MNLFLNFLNNSFLNKIYVFFLSRKMIRAQFQIRCSFKNGTMFHHFEKISKHEAILYKNITTRLSILVLFEKKARTGYMISRYIHVSKVFCYAAENFVCGAIRLFSRTNLWYQPNPVSFLSPILLFFSLAKIEVSASTRLDSTMRRKFTS